MPKPSDPLIAAMMSPFRSADVPIRLTPMFLEGKGTDGKMIHRGKKEPVAAKADPETGIRAVEAAITLAAQDFTIR